MDHPDNLVVEEVSEAGIFWQVLTDVEAVNLKVAGEYGIVFEHGFDSSEPLRYDLITRDGSPLKNGSYQYELRLTRKLNPEEERLRWEAEESATEPEMEISPLVFRAGGHFRVSGGTIDTSFQVPIPEPGFSVPVTESTGAVPMDAVTGNFYVLGGLCTGCTEAGSGDLPNEELKIRWASPRLRFESISGTDWWIRSSGGGNNFEITDTGGTFGHITFLMMRGSPLYSFVMDRAGNLGLGTSIPEAELHIIGKGTSGDPTIRLEATGTPAQEYEWEIAGSESGFFVKDVTASRTAFSIEAGAPTASLLVSPSGNIGLGTKTPSEALHVKRSTGTSKILVEETSASTTVRTQFQLKNNGAHRFALENTSSGVEWSFQQSGPGNFLISKGGTGGPEMQVYQNGQVRMGPGGTNKFTLSPTGNLTIAGSLTANGSTFPDYVFEPDYALMPLSELRAYISHEKRLPKIPSAEETKGKGGHNMTELQLLLLEKIEELTLYTLKQDERLEEKEHELLDQDQRIAVLEAQLNQIQALLKNR